MVVRVARHCVSSDEFFFNLTSHRERENECGLVSKAEHLSEVLWEDIDCYQRLRDHSSGGDTGSQDTRATQHPRTAARIEAFCTS